MERRKGKQKQHRRVKLQMVVLLLLFTLLATLLTGWILYDRTSDQVIRDTWQQQEALVRSACSAVNREIEQVRTFSWQLGNDNGVQRYLHLADETPTDILAKRNIIEKLQQMKAFSNTMADIGIYAEGLDIIITGESSYHSADYYARIDGITRQDMEEKRSIPGSVALSRYAGRGTVSRILSTEPVLAFVSSLPLNTQAGESYAFFHLNADKLMACLPESDAGTLLLTDAEGNPVLAADTPDSGEACREYMREKQNRIRIGGSEYGVLGLETASDGLFCMAVIPYSELLKPSLRLRDVVMLVMGSCMVIGLLGAVLASKRLYAPLERLLGNVRQLGHSLPEETRAYPITEANAADGVRRLWVEAAGDGVGEVVYANMHLDEDTTLLVKVGKADSKGLAKVTATLKVEGTTVKFTGKASTATGIAKLTNRKRGELELQLGAETATGTLDLREDNRFAVDAARVSPFISSVSGLDALCVGVAVSGSVALDEDVQVRYSAKKLPRGVKINAKTGAITGSPRTAGSGTAVISAKCKIAVEGERRPVSATVARQVAWQVAALDDFAQGKFAGDNVAITISKTGKLSGSVTIDGKKVRLSAKSYATREDGAYVSEGKVRGGTFVVVVDATGLHGMLTTESGTTSFEATRALRTRK